MVVVVILREMYNLFIYFPSKQTEVFEVPVTPAPVSLVVQVALFSRSVYVSLYMH